MKNTTVRSHSRSVKGKGNATVKRHARTVKKGKKFVSSGFSADQYERMKESRGKNIHEKINSKSDGPDHLNIRAQLRERKNGTPRQKKKSKKYWTSVHSPDFLSKNPALSSGKGSKAKRRSKK